jgi:hypothetical protein
MVKYRKKIQGNYIQQAKNFSRTNFLNASNDLGFKWQSYLPLIYAGQPKRRERYNQYDIMDADPEINASLDIIAEFCTQTDQPNNLPFRINTFESMSDTEMEIIRRNLIKWTRINEFERRLFNIFRNTIKYGDQIFIKHPKTKKWLWIDPARVASIIVNSAKGKKPEFYVVEGLDVNLETLVATTPPPAYQQTTGLVARSPGPVTYSYPRMDSTLGRYTAQATQPAFIAAENIVHISLSDGMDNNWPFGNSILESVYKVFKQKELLEDSIIIYRVQRAPERRVFYIDVGDMSPAMANQYINRIKNQIHQRRIPTFNGGGESVMSTAYNPLSILEDYFFAQSADGRGSKVEVLPGGDQLGQIDDLIYFDRKLRRGLRIPNAYLPGSTEEGGSYSDGKVGTAFIQEFRFNKYCMRLQQAIIQKFDEEFKNYMKSSGVELNFDSFEIQFHEPQNFSRYRQIEIDSAQASVFTSLADIPYLSKRFLMKRFLNLSDEEIFENERLWEEENEIKDEDDIDDLNVNLPDVGIHSTDMNYSDNLETEEPEEDVEEVPEEEKVEEEIKSSFEK